MRSAGVQRAGDRECAVEKIDFTVAREGKPSIRVQAQLDRPAHARGNAQRPGHDIPAATASGADFGEASPLGDFSGEQQATVESERQRNVQAVDPELERLDVDCGEQRKAAVVSEPPEEAVIRDVQQLDVSGRQNGGSVPTARGQLGQIPPTESAERR